MKIFVWAVLTIFFATIWCVIFKIWSKKRKKHNLERFSDNRYLIGAAIINMERATLYADFENFKFFARYAIRISLGMEKSFPPNEPTSKEMISKLSEKGFSRSEIDRIMKIYDINDISTNEDQCRNIIKNTKNTVNLLLQRPETIRFIQKNN